VYLTKQSEPISDVNITMTTTGRQNSHGVQLAGRVVQPIGVDAVVELHEVRVQRYHRRAVWRCLGDDCMNGGNIKAWDGEQSTSYHATLCTQYIM